jgi:hypothetical protein
MVGLPKSGEGPQFRSDCHATVEALLEAVFFHVSDQGFIGETAFSFGEFSVGVSRGRFVVEDLNV